MPRRNLRGRGWEAGQQQGDSNEKVVQGWILAPDLNLQSHSCYEVPFPLVSSINACLICLYFISRSWLREEGGGGRERREEIKFFERKSCGSFVVSLFSQPPHPVHAQTQNISFTSSGGCLKQNPLLHTHFNCRHRYTAKETLGKEGALAQAWNRAFLWTRNNCIWDICDVCSRISELLLNFFFHKCFWNQKTWYRSHFIMNYKMPPVILTFLSTFHFDFFLVNKCSGHVRGHSGCWPFTSLTSSHTYQQAAPLSLPSVCPGSTETCVLLARGTSQEAG